MATLDDLIAQAVIEEKKRVAAEQEAKEQAAKKQHIKAMSAFDAYVQRVFPRLSQTAGVLGYTIKDLNKYAKTRHDVVLTITDRGATWEIKTYTSDNGPGVIIIEPDLGYDLSSYTSEANAEHDLLLSIARYRKEHTAIPTLVS